MYFLTRWGFLVYKSLGWFKNQKQEELQGKHRQKRQSHHETSEGEEKVERRKGKVVKKKLKRRNKGKSKGRGSKRQKRGEFVEADGGDETSRHQKILSVTDRMEEIGNTGCRLMKSEFTVVDPEKDFLSPVDCIIRKGKDQTKKGKSKFSYL